MGFELPPPSKVGYLDPEIAGEGTRVIYSDGEQVTWTPPPPQPVMPDMSQIKSIRKYFNKTGHVVWPAWLYHPTESNRLVKDAHEAAALGVCYRQATQDERGKYGLSAVWDWKDDSQWRPLPWTTPKFDPANPGQGKTYIPAQISPQRQQTELVATVVAAVTQMLKSSGPSAPASIDPKQWDEFVKFQAWQKANEVVAAAPVGQQEAEPQINALNAEEPDEKAHWTAEAERKGIKLDGRWSLERIKAEVLKAA